MRTDWSALANMICERVSCFDLGQDFGLAPGRDGRCACVFCGGARKDTLRLYPGNRGYYCFRCHTGGTVINLYMQMTGCGFRDAVREINDRYGLGLPVDSNDRDAMEQARKQMDRARREREAEEERQKKLLENLWDAGDAVDVMEKTIRNRAPKTLEESWDETFCAALKYRDQMKEHRDDLYAKVYGKKS